ncbi:hypothetical protein ACTQ5K_13155 [Niallia sp. Sow4_A1]|uniref:hypothetical protein n=1 Tax=Bacillaceae TaxID=186817 RepID=UPI001261E629|nr:MULTISPECIES: hypothetical protein [Bacillaceae]MCM3363110.1 hypothetical protein [Niallia sp. MER TA 168]
MFEALEFDFLGFGRLVVVLAFEALDFALLGFVLDSEALVPVQAHPVVVVVAVLVPQWIGIVDYAQRMFGHNVRLLLG